LSSTLVIPQFIYRFQNRLPVVRRRHPAGQAGADAANIERKTVAFTEFGAYVLSQKFEVLQVVGPENFAGKVKLKPEKKKKKNSE